MKDSFIFKGTSFVLGNYEILNDEIEKYVKSIIWKALIIIELKIQKIIKNL